MPAIKEIEDYRRFTGPAEHHKAINSFLGILEGIAIDQIVDSLEVQELKHWYELHRHLIDRHPFNEILPAIDVVMADQIITGEEVEDLRWLCQQVSSKHYYNLITSALQTLHGLIHGLLANNIISDIEISSLREWLDDHSILKGTYPFDEIYSIVCAVLEDGTVTEDERNTLKAFLSEFIDLRDSYNLSEPELTRLREHYSVHGICAKDPEIVIPGSVFCFTGASKFATRNEIADIVCSHGGTFTNSVTQQTQYLIVGNDGNPCWAFACYGRKVEKAIAMRKAGGSIVIVNEVDFWSAIEKISGQQYKAKQPIKSDEQITLFEAPPQEIPVAYRAVEETIRNMLADRAGFDINTEFTYNKSNLAVSLFNFGSNSRCFWITLGSKTHKLEIKYSYCFLIDSLVEKRGSIVRSSNGRAVFRFADLNELLSYKSLILDIYDYCEREAKGRLFDCCHRYLECSSAKDCTHPDKEFSMCCSYRRKLKQGIIFYGTNRNV